MITKLCVSNFKRVRAVQCHPDGPLVTVGGKNGAGKSSVLDAIMAALGGTRVNPQQPVRKGADGASVELTLANGYTVRRVYLSSGHSELHVLQPDGQPARSPQSLLNGWLGDLAFDPLEFERLKPGEQAGRLKELLGLDTSELDRSEEEAYERRRDVHRQIKDIEAQAKTYIGCEGAPDEEVSVAQLAEQLKQAHAVNSAHALRVAERDGALGLVQKLRAELVAAEDRLTAVGSVDSEPIDARPIEAAIAEAESVNRAVRLKQSLGACRAKWRELEDCRVGLEREIEDARRARAKMLEEAPFPHPGLAFGPEGVTLAGLPFEQASQAERLRALVAIGLAANPELRIMLVREGSLLDKSSLAELALIAAQKDAQVWVEVVAEPDASGEYPTGLQLIIEDGSQMVPTLDDESLTCEVG